MREVGKRLRSENRWELLQEKRTHMKLTFLERAIPVDLSVIKFVKILCFPINLHQESLNAPYSIWYHWKDKVSLFKTVYRLIRKQVLVKVPVQRKVETPKILLSARVARLLKSAATRAAQKMLTLEELERKGGKFFILAITK